MTLSNVQKILILTLGVLLLLYFMNKDCENYAPVTMKREHMTTVSQPSNSSNASQLTDTNISSALDNLVSNDNATTYTTSTNNDTSIRKKMLSKNSALGGNKKVSYDANTRQSNNRDQMLDDFFERGNSVTNPDTTQGPFMPLNDKNTTGDSYAPYVNGSAAKQSTNDIFDLDNFLPKQVNDDWFDNVPEPISVKNRYLINISKQVGVNTIGSSHKNPSWDLRGEVYCPKFVVSPWMQSSIEPDTSLVGLCGSQN
jgi:hypothetical protein